MIVYVSIGNSDDKLTQAEWAAYCAEIAAGPGTLGHIHGAWFSLTPTRYQNACWCIEFASEADMHAARQSALEVRMKYRQESVAWAVAETEFV